MIFNALSNLNPFFEKTETCVLYFGSCKSGILKSLVGDYDRYGLCSNQTPNGSTEKRFQIDAHSFWSYPIKSFLGWSQPMRDQSITHQFEIMPEHDVRDDSILECIKDSNIDHTRWLPK